MNYFPGCLNSLESTLDYSKSTLCPPACVCLEPLALVVLFTRGLPQLHVSFDVVEFKLQLLPVSQLSLYLCCSRRLLHRTLGMEFTSTRCDVSAWLTHCSTFKWYHSHIKPFILVFLFLWEIQLWIKGVLALV